jgi:hypothetical protein
MPYLACGETVRAPPAMPLSAPAVDEGAGESAAEETPVDWVLAVEVPDGARPAGTVVTVEPRSTST